MSVKKEVGVSCRSLYLGFSNWKSLYNTCNKFRALLAFIRSAGLKVMEHKSGFLC